MRLIYTAVIICYLAFVVPACGAGAPNMPTQVPTSIEYATGKVAGKAVVQMDGSALLHAYNDSHEMVDASTVSCYMVDQSGTIVTDGSCGAISTDATDISYLAPSNYASNLLSTCDIKCDRVEDSAALATEPVYITLNPDKLADSYSFGQARIRSDGVYMNVAEHNGVLHTCFIGVEYREPPDFPVAGWFPKDIYYSSSSDYGVTWSDAVRIAESDSIQYCQIAANDDLVAVAWSELISAEEQDYGDRISFLDHNGTLISRLDVIDDTLAAMAGNVQLSNAGTAYIVSSTYTDDTGTLYFTSCTTSSCSEPVKLMEHPYSFTNIPEIAYYEDESAGISKVYGALTFVDPVSLATSVYLMDYDIPGGTITNHLIAESGADLGDLAGAATTVDRYGIPMITFLSANVTGEGLVSTIYISRYDGSAPAYYPVTDVDDINMPDMNRIFVTLDNYVHTLYITYGGASGIKGLHHAIGHFNGSEYVSDTSAMVEESFEPNAYELNMSTDKVGRAYLFWNRVDIDPSGALNDTTTYMLKGVVQ